MEKANYSNKLFCAMCVLFVLGNNVITAPINNANKYNFLAFLLSFILSISVYFLFFYIPFSKVFMVVVWLLAFLCVGQAFTTFITFISDNLLPQTEPILIAISFLILIIYAFFRGNAVLKFSFVSIFVIAAVFLVFFLSTAKDFNVKNIFIYNIPSFAELGNQLLPYVWSVALPTGILAVFARLNGFSKKTGVLGIGIGFILLGICLLNTVLLFGINLSSTLDYPYSSVGSTVTFGDLFTRLDGLLYFVYLATSLVKCVVGILVIKKSRECIP